MSLASKFFCAASISVPLLIAASGSAQTEAPERKGPDCRAFLEGHRGTFQAVPSAGRAFSQLIDQYNATIKTANAQKTSYRQFRKDGKMAEAKNMAAQLDNTWSELDSLQRQIVSQTHNGMSAANAWCDVVASLAAMGCTRASSKAQPSCAKIQSQWSKASSAPIMTKTQYATTWRKPEDYKFDPPPAPCPAVEQASPEPRPGGEVREIRGRAFVVRGMRSYPVKVGMKLEPADIIAVEESSMVQIYLHESGVLKITEKTKFEIPKPQAPETESGSFAKIGDALKKGLQGPSLEVKCSGGGGARG